MLFELFHGMNLSSEGLNFEADRLGFSISGPAVLGDVEISLDGYKNYINKEEFISKYNLTAIINEKNIEDSFKIKVDDFITGTIGLKATYLILKNNKEIQLNCKKLTNPGQIKAVSYSNNLKPEILEQHKKFQVTEYKKMKSSLKFCVIATGEYDLYVAEPRASEWDIAAGHAILKNAGGKISDFNGNEILYGKKDFKNSSIILKRSSVL